MSVYLKVSISPALALLTLACTLLCGVALGQTTTTVVDVPTRNVTQRFLYVRPAAPIANIIAIPGGEGYFDILDDGTFNYAPTRCFPVYRVRQALADRGYSIGFVDRASDGSIYDKRDSAEVQRYMQQRDNVPTWIIGGSASSTIAAVLASFLPASSPVGVIFFSPPPLPASILAPVRRAALVVYHVRDFPARPTDVYNGLTSAPVKEKVGLDGGSDSGNCGYHLFNGIEDLFVATITGFMERNNNALAPDIEVAIEYYHQVYDHYFITHNAEQIAILDKGDVIMGWTRTGQSFKVWTVARADTSPVCRFYIPPAKGDSHYYGRDPVECNATAAREPTFINEDPQFFHIVLPTAGACPAGTRNVYRTFSNRPDVNHRYMIDPAIRDQMVALGWIAEGAGPDLVVMCAPP